MLVDTIEIHMAWMGHQQTEFSYFSGEKQMLFIYWIDIFSFRWIVFLILLLRVHCIKVPSDDTWFIFSQVTNNKRLVFSCWLCHHKIKCCLTSSCCFSWWNELIYFMYLVVEALVKLNDSKVRIIWSWTFCH